MTYIIPPKARSLAIKVISVAFVLHLLYGALFILEIVNQRNVHLTLALLLVFLIKPTSEQSTKISKPFSDLIDIAIIGLVLFQGIYMATQAAELTYRQGIVLTGDYISFVLVMLLILEATRRLMGVAIPILIILCLLYIYFGPYMPGFLQHAGMSFDRLTGFLYTNQVSGIYGSILGISASYIALFIVFGSVMVKSGVGELFFNLSNSLFGKFRGGPAKIAVFVSALFGMVNGAATANVATTGQFTIPTMKRIGYKNKFAGAVEAVASSGGQIMPPIMGVGAFLMADIIGVPYSDIVISATIPAVVYFIAVYFSVDFEAARLNLQGLPKSDRIPLKHVLKTQIIYVIPIFVLVYLFIFVGMSPGKSAFWGIVSAIVVTWFTKEDRMGVKKTVEAFSDGANTSMMVVILCASAGIIIGTFGVSGLALKITSGLVSLSGGELWMLLVFAMIASIVLGMGMPTGTAYILVAILVAPAIIQLGVEPLAAHLFVFYFAVFSAITPPVALAAFAASSIAGAGPYTIAVTSMRLALAAFLIPFAFVYGNELLLLRGSILEIAIAAISAIFGAYILAIAVIGYWKSKVNIGFRILLLLVSVLTISTGYMTDIAGIILGGLLLFFMLLKHKKTIMFNVDSNSNISETEAGK
ncbi:TRAP transporter permease [Bacillus dakarensis]|uniref:TRAP transporter permease n=1 Tax=Robertmurraya dakarensis TaxID=1926278 RepID=UPI0009822DBD|nr:TRAP transporter fused permease subunit [Bacillus dakarensis]